MAQADEVTAGDRPLVAASMFGNTTQCVEASRQRLEAAGFEVLVFHATRTGGRTMEDLVASGFIAGVLDVTTTELADELVGGVMSAGPHRLGAAARAGIPAVVAPGCLDMVNFWTPDSIPETYRGRCFYHHNPDVTLMRTTPAENPAQGTLELALKALLATRDKSYRRYHQLAILVQHARQVISEIRGLQGKDRQRRHWWWILWLGLCGTIVLGCGSRIGAAPDILPETLADPEPRERVPARSTVVPTPQDLEPQSQSSQAVTVCDHGLLPDRTPAVAAALAAALAGTDCGPVSAVDLAAIRTLQVTATDLGGLQAADFAGLENLESLQLRLQRADSEPTLTLRPTTTAGLWVRAGPGTAYPTLELLTVAAETYTIVGRDALDPGWWEIQLNAYDALRGRQRFHFGWVAAAYVQTQGDTSQVPVSVLTPNLFVHLPQLRHLDLAQSGLSVLPAGLFAPLSQLQSLDLAQNRLKILSPDLFTGLSQLQRLDLGNDTTVGPDQNELMALPMGLFADLGQLASLQIALGDLVSLQTATFTGLDHLQALRLQLDPYRAGAATLRLQDGMTVRHLPVQGGPGPSYDPLDMRDSWPAAATYTIVGRDAVPPSWWEIRREAGPGFQQGWVEAASVQTQGDTSRVPVSVLPPDLFGHLTQLRHLDLARSALTVLPPGLFEGLRQLQTLRLEGNYLSALPPDLFGGLGQLQTLHLYTEMPALPSGLFGGLGQLQTLHLGRSYQSTLPSGLFGGLHQLQHLTLYGAELPVNVLPSGLFGGLGQLQHLHLHNVYLPFLPAGFFADLGRLRTLKMDHIWLEEATLDPDTFVGLTGLQRLQLHAPRPGLATLPVGLFAPLGQLQSLEIRSADLHRLEPGIFHGLPHLRSLQLLRGFHGDGQGLDLVPGAFAGLVQLQSLTMTVNSPIPAGAFAGLAQLQSLDMTVNSPIPAGAFAGLAQLRSLNLWSLSSYSSRDLLSLQPGAFAGLETLQVLKLFGRLECLPTTLWADLPRLHTLDLRHVGLVRNPPGPGLSPPVQILWGPVAAAYFQHLPGLDRLQTLHLGDDRWLDVRHLEFAAYRASLPQLQGLQLPATGTPIYPFCPPTADTP